DTRFRILHLHLQAKHGSNRGWNDRRVSDRGQIDVIHRATKGIDQGMRHGDRDSRFPHSTWTNDAHESMLCEQLDEHLHRNVASNEPSESLGQGVLCGGNRRSRGPQFPGRRLGRHWGYGSDEAIPAAWKVDDVARAAFAVTQTLAQAGDIDAQVRLV